MGKDLIEDWKREGEIGIGIILSNGERVVVGNDVKDKVTVEEVHEICASLKSIDTKNWYW